MKTLSLSLFSREGKRQILHAYIAQKIKIPFNQWIDRQKWLHQIEIQGRLGSTGQLVHNRRYFLTQCCLSFVLKNKTRSISSPIYFINNLSIYSAFFSLKHHFISLFVKFSLKPIPHSASISRSFACHCERTIASKSDFTCFRLHRKTTATNSTLKPIVYIWYSSAPVFSFTWRVIIISPAS